MRRWIALPSRAYLTEYIGLLHSISITLVPMWRGHHEKAICLMNLGKPNQCTDREV